MSKTDIIIIGGGMVGLALAAALSKAQFKVTVVESKAPRLQWNETDYDARVSAINLASYRFLNYLNVWSDLRLTCVSSMEQMKVWDAVGGGEIAFDAAEINKDVLGYIVENREIVRVLWEKLSQDPNVQLLFPYKAEKLTAPSSSSASSPSSSASSPSSSASSPSSSASSPSSSASSPSSSASSPSSSGSSQSSSGSSPSSSGLTRGSSPITLDCQLKPDNDVARGSKKHTLSITASLIIGADGARSWLRDQMPADMQEKPYQHNAVVAVIKTEKPHARTAFQPFLKTGPLGVLPLSDTHHVGIVWSTNPAHSEKLITMSPNDFNRELTNALGTRLGNMHCLSERKAIPLTMRHAKHYISKQLALVGDAAHTIHPLAGQGVNLGFMDAACLAETLQNAKENEQNIGSERVLRRYERWRKGDNTLMLLAMRGFKECFADQSPLCITLRSFGLNITNRLSFLKNNFMQTALNDSDDLPKSAQ